MTKSAIIFLVFVYASCLYCGFCFDYSVLKRDDSEFKDYFVAVYDTDTKAIDRQLSIKNSEIKFAFQVFSCIFTLGFIVFGIKFTRDAYREYKKIHQVDG